MTTLPGMKTTLIVALSDESMATVERLERLCAEMRSLGLIAGRPMLDDAGVILAELDAPEATEKPPCKT